MDSDKHCIVLTDNTWLYSGLSSLFPEIRWYKMSSNLYEIADLPDSRDMDLTFILLDSLLLFQGGLIHFYTLINQYPNARVIWLCHPRTGFLFPASRLNDMWINQKSCMREIKYKLTRILKYDDGNLLPRIMLTKNEHKYMSSLLSGIHILLQSKLGGVTEKTLYTHQYNILRKVGIRTIGCLRFLSRKNAVQTDDLWWMTPPPASDSLLPSA